MHEKRAVVDTAFHRYQLSGVREEILPETRTLYPHVVGRIITSGPSVVSGSAHRPGLSIVGFTGAEVDSDSVSIYQDQMSFDDRERGAHPVLAKSTWTPLPIRYLEPRAVWPGWGTRSEAIRELHRFRGCAGGRRPLTPIPVRYRPGFRRRTGRWRMRPPGSGPNSLKTADGPEESRLSSNSHRNSALYGGAELFAMAGHHFQNLHQRSIRASRSEFLVFNQIS